MQTQDIPVSKLFKGADKTLKIYSGMEDDEDTRDRLSAVGKIGLGGQFVHHIIAVQMLSEGWNCRTLTHIMGLRAFSSQLLCEQTIGRGLRRMSYELNKTGMFEPEYVNVLGVPFAYLPQEGSDTGRVEEEPRNCLFPEKERKPLIIMMKMNEIVNQVFSLIQKDSVEKLTAMFNKDTPFFSTNKMQEWWTKKQTAIFKKSHINQCVVDSSWEYTPARELDKNKKVLAWVKNDHLGFNVDYIDEKGKMRNYKPDFIARISQTDYLILEVKGIKKPRDIKKWDFMNNWCKAVSESLENQNWHFKISQDATGGAVHKLIEKVLNKNSG